MKEQIEAYAGKPVSEKLGIKANSVLGLVNAPRGFKKALGKLPEGATLHKQAQGGCDLVIWFVRSRDELDRGIGQIVVRAQRAKLWIAWPKKASSMTSDLLQQHVREAGLAMGLVDYKVCSIDDTWSGQLFTRRKVKE